MSNPTYTQTATALRTALANAVSSLSGVQIVPETSTFSPDAKNVMLLQAFRPSETETAELGGRLALAKRHGLYLVTVSAPYGDSDDAATAFSVAETVENAFRHEDFSAGGGYVHCFEPFSTIVGKDADQRYSIAVSIPFTTWTGGDA